MGNVLTDGPKSDAFADAVDRTARVVPQVNLNGTSREALVQQQVAVLDALAQAVMAMSLATPHGRDYQTMPAGSYEAAREQHADRSKRLWALNAEITELALAIQAQ
jgi:hypothetical protein